MFWLDPADVLTYHYLNNKKQKQESEVYIDCVKCKIIQRQLFHDYLNIQLAHFGNHTKMTTWSILLWYPTKISEKVLYNWVSRLSNFLHCIPLILRN